MLGKKIIIVGGGLAGLITAIRLARKSFSCTILEKKAYPFHRVCGEYISNEVQAFLRKEGLYPERFNPPQIHQLQLSSVSGKSTSIQLNSGGFGISRYTYDGWLYEIAKDSGVQFALNTEVDSIHRADDKFIIHTQQQELEGDLVIGAIGKRSKLDVQLSRDFIKKRSPYVGVKYHARTDHSENTIALHNFSGGYCGMSNVEDHKTNICYLIHRDYLKQYGSIEAVEKNVLSKNPHLKRIFSEANFLFQKPEVINEISFETKEPVYNNIFMTGDAAGMIAPLCGNGMAMAIHSAKILSDLIVSDPNATIPALAQSYTKLWQKNFSKRLWIGRQLQNNLFGNEFGSSFATGLAIQAPFMARALVSLTHGKPIQ